MEIKLVTVSVLAKDLNITVDTVRYYTRIGFLLPTKNKISGYKCYSKEDKKRLKFIVHARQLGFSVKDIKQILEHDKKQDTACPTVRKLIENRLKETDAQFLELKQLRSKMKNAIEQWKYLPDENSSNEAVCHLIESFFEKEHG